MHAIWKPWGLQSPVRLELPTVRLSPRIGKGSLVIVHERDRERFLSYLFRAYARGAQVVLANPDWSKDGWHRVQDLFGPVPVLGTRPPIPWRVRHGLCSHTGSFGVEEGGSLAAFAGRSCLLIPTGGSTGRIRFAIHTAETLLAAAVGYLDRVGWGAANTLVLLPLHHVGGLLQVLRALVSGGAVRFASWKSVESSRGAGIAAEGRHLSLVPTQLRRILADREFARWLGRFSLVLCGGASCSEELRSRCRELGIPLAISYGMTETAGAATLLPPAQLQSGVKGNGYPLPHGEIFIRDSAGIPVSNSRPGRVIVRSKALCHGHFPGELFSRADGMATGDRGYFDASGSLHVEGRMDYEINSGGEKVNPEEVEEILHSLRGIRDVAVLGVPDPEWGERVVALVVPEDPRGVTEDDEWRQALRDRLTPYQRPKLFLSVAELPRNFLGKIDRSQLADNPACAGL